MRKLFALAMVAMLALALANSMMGCAKKTEEDTSTTIPAEPMDTSMVDTTMVDTTMSH